jgi:hypothetical protein
MRASVNRIRRFSSASSAGGKSASDLRIGARHAQTRASGAHAIQRDTSGLAGLGRENHAGVGLAKENNGGRDPASARFSDPSGQYMEAIVIDWHQTSTMTLIRRLIRPAAVITVGWVVLAATVATAQQSTETVTESVTTRRDVNGKELVSEKVVTHRERTKDEERVVIETHIPLMYADRLELNRRVRRVTTVTQDGTQTVEETEERNSGSPSEPLRVVQRSLTTVRKSGDDSYVSERHVYKRDVNGRFVPVLTETERTSRD